MPFKCSVPGCVSNYKTPYISCFRFPKEEERKNMWLSRIRRHDFHPTDSARVCIKHFSDDMILMQDEWFDKNGVRHLIPRKNPILTADAFPCIVNETVPHLNARVPKKRKTREEKEEDNIQEVLAKSVLTHEAEIRNSKLQNILQLKEYLEDVLKSYCNWYCLVSGEDLIIFKLSVDDNPRITISLKVSENLNFEIFCLKEKINIETLGLSNNKIENKYQVDLIVKNCDEYVVKAPGQNKFLKAVKLLKECRQDVSEEKQEMLDILIEQLNLINTPKERYRFSSLLLQLSFKIFLSSPSCYKSMRKTKLLILPHHSNLKKIASKLNVCNSSYNVKSNYLEKRLSVLTPNEKYINLLLDEVYISPQLSFKGGKLTGLSITNSSKLAKTAQVFSITSSFGSYKDVIAILPIHENSGEFLYEITKKILHDLQELGVNTLSIITDNNQVNKSLFTYFKPHPYGYQSVLNPASSNMPLFLFYDSVHIFKNIRNNWINQNNLILHYPDFEGKGNIATADFKHLREIYSKEKDSLLKYGYKLNHKALYPSNVERQKVSLVCKVFNYENINALKEIGGDKTKGTCNFLSIILKWWNIINVKSLNKDTRYKNDDFKAIMCAEQDQLKFLEHILNWLNKWSILSRGNLYNGLSNRTFDAFQRTCNGLYGLALFALKDLKIKFILFGKFQTDPLEERFSLYRQLSGSNYYISLEQLIESEKKIRVQNLLFYNKQKYSFKCLENKCNSSINLNEFEELEIDMLKPIDKKIVPIILFIAGYAAFKTCKNITCKSCIEILISNEDFEYEFSEECRLIDNLDRGSLKRPTAFTFKTASMCFLIFEKILSDFYNVFLANENQLNLLLKISEPYIKNIVSDIDEHTCKYCTHDSFTFFKNVMQVVYKILLNNYSKMVTENFNKEKEEKRKIKKLTNK